MVIDEAVECLEYLLANDEDLLGLLLTERRQRRDRGEDRPLEESMHVQVEVLVEAYHRRLVLIKHQVCVVLSYVLFYVGISHRSMFISHFYYDCTKS